MKILVTGSAGFIGFHLAQYLLERKYEVVGIDNINDYYDVNLKFNRLNESGILQNTIEWNQISVSNKYPQYRFIRMNLENKSELMDLCKNEKFDVIIHLAAQAGVRYSIQNPDAYIQSNLIGFFNILEAARVYPVKHLIYASSSSVYGDNRKIPFSVNDKTESPISLYAATKKSNELMAYAYSHLYNVRSTGLRFFTVYGPWGRPDMAYFLFAEAIKNGQPIKVFNHGKLKRDFTYIDDVVEAIGNILDKIKGQKNEKVYNIYNIGNNKPEELLNFIKELEKNMGKIAIKEYVSMQQGDVESTWADINELINEFNYKPKTTISDGLLRFSEWYKNYYEVK